MDAGPPFAGVRSSDRTMSANGSFSTAVDDSDLQKLDGRIESSLQAARLEGSGENWVDSGYGLVFVLLLLATSWFRKGWRIVRDA